VRADATCCARAGGTPDGEIKLIGPDGTLLDRMR
jgi:hypothetical protein